MQVMIFDFDVHHGNGTQAAFYNDPNILIIDQHEDGVYPQEGGKIDEIGEGKGKGTTINIPLPGTPCLLPISCLSHSYKTYFSNLILINNN